MGLPLFVIPSVVEGSSHCRNAKILRLPAVAQDDKIMQKGRVKTLPYHDYQFAFTFSMASMPATEISSVTTGLVRRPRFMQDTMCSTS